MMKGCRSEGESIMDEKLLEMANELYETLMLEADCSLSGMDCAIIADLLINKGYRKIPEGAIILTKEEIAALNKYQSTRGDQIEK